MKKLLILPLLVLLTGCVTYYYPETALEDGVYYAEDDPSYPAPTYMVYAGAYPGFSYYPWSSIDYFYMGYYPYPGFSVGYGYPGGVSFGISYVYSPWYYPYNSFGYYSPWYAHHYYPHYPAWYPYDGYCSHGHNCGHGKKKGRHGDGSDRYAGNGQDDPRDRSNDDPWDDSNNSDHDLQDAGAGSSTVRRYVSTAPAGYSGNRGMVIRSNESKAIDKSYVHQDKSAPGISVNTTPAPEARAAQPAYSTKRTANEVRYRSDAKQSGSKTGPVASGPSSISTTRSASRPATSSKPMSSSRHGKRSRPVSSRSAGRAGKSPGSSRHKSPD